MLDDEHSLNPLEAAPQDDEATSLSDYDQWFPILSFDGSRVTITRPTDAMETTVIQPVRVPSPPAPQPSAMSSGSTVSKINDGDTTHTPPSTSEDHDSDNSAANVETRSIEDTVWLQMRKRSEIQTTDGRMIKLVPTTSHADASNQSANSLVGLVESTAERAVKGTAEARSVRVEEKHRAMVERRARRLRITIVVSAVVTAISLVALVASIA